MDDLRSLVEGKIPFQGQRLADRINQEVIVFGAIVAWLLGYYFQSMYLCMTFFGASCAVALLACVPPWPMYKKHPVIWQPNRPHSEETTKAKKSSWL